MDSDNYSRFDNRDGRYPASAPELEHSEIGLYSIDPPEVVHAVETTKETYRSKIRIYQLVIFICTIALVIVLYFVLNPILNKKKSDSVVKYTTNGNLTVFYAASLKDILTRELNPEFTSNYGVNVIGTAAGSGALATSIQKGAHADIFISADSSYNELLTHTTPPFTNWYCYWTRTRLGFAYNTESSFAPIFRGIENGTLKWYEVIDKNEMKIGRTDPAQDPKGYRTLIMIRLAEKYYGVSGIENRIIGTNQIYSEQNLEALLSSGDLDIGFFYEGEQEWGGTTKMNFIPLPQHIDFSNSTFAKEYAKANYTNPSTKKVNYGTPIVYSLSILNRAANKKAAISYINFLRSKEGTENLNEQGFFIAQDQSFHGNLTSIPSEITAFKVTVGI